MKDPAMQWVEAARLGDEQAARHLVEEFHARVYAFLRRLAGSESDAVELTQQAFCRAWSALPAFEGRASVASWLHGIAYRTYVDWLRSDRRFETRSDPWWQALPDGGTGPDRATSERDAAAAAYAAVDRLQGGLREVLHLHYYQGLTIEETAYALGVATSTVKYRAREAIAQVRAALAEGASGMAAPSTRGTGVKASISED